MREVLTRYDNGRTLFAKAQYSIDQDTMLVAAGWKDGAQGVFRLPTPLDAEKWRGAIVGEARALGMDDTETGDFIDTVWLALR